MSDVPPTEGQGGDDVSKQEPEAASEPSPVAAAQGEARYPAAPDGEKVEGEAPADSQPQAADSQPQAAKGDDGAAGATAGQPSEPADGAEQPQPASATVQQETRHGCPLVDSLGAAVVHCDRSRYGALMAALKSDSYDLMVGVTAVDYLTHPGRALPDGVEAQRFEVVVELARVEDRARLRVRCQVPESDASLPTLFELWAGSEAHEREVYDMYGIAFDGHPDPSRILMPEDWEGHPLRKDYASGRIPVQFKESPSGR